MEKNQYGDFSGSIQNRVQLDPTVTNDASQSKRTIWKDISSWFTEEMQICRREKSLGLRKTPTVKKHKLGELWFRSELCYTRIYSCQIPQESKGTQDISSSKICSDGVFPQGGTESPAARNPYGTQKHEGKK